MSLQADGLKPCDRQVEQEEHGMQLYNNNNNNNKPITPTFVSSKSSSSSSPIIHPVNNPLSFIDDDLVTWLQYPLDDGVACPDMFQHWPPAPSPAPLHPNPSPSPVLTKDQNEPTLMVDIAPSAPPPLQVSDRCTSPVDETDHHNSNAHLNLVSHSSEGRIMQEVLKQRAADTQQHDPLFKHSNNLAPAALGAALRQVGDGDRQGAAKDSRKLLPPEDERGWAAKEAHLVTNADSHSRHSEKRKAAAGEDPDNNWTRTTQLRQQPQHEGLAHVNLPAQHNVVGSSSGNTLQKEASANFLCRKEKSLAGKDLSRKQSATTDGAQGSMNAQANRAADAALALGAGRAAGVIRPSGMEAFSKVRTSLQQPIRPSKLGSPPAVYTLSPTSPSGKYTSYPTSYSPPVLTPRGRAFGFRDFTLSSQPVQQTLHNAAQPYWFRPCANFPSMASQEHQLMCSNTSKNSHMESSTTALLASHGTEELSMGLKQAPRTEQAKDIGVGRSAAAASGLSLPYRDKKDDVVFSGGSETSESLKETFSGSKRKLDDSECQSEDAEGESAVNSQARSSSSKRTRANEVHNLSERRRRNRINDKMNALRELIPNATKSNKAALLDEAIDYLKSLQLQLQVMSMRTGVTLSPMVLPPGLPHMQMPIHPMGIGTTGGCSSGMGLGGAGSTVGVAMCDMTYGVPAGPLTSLTSPDPMMLQPSANSSNIEPQVITAPESASSQFLHPFVHASQPIFSFNMDMYNTYLQQQQLQQHLHHQEQLASPQVQASSQQPPSSQQQSHYQL